jgi:hypothetical protein
MPGSFRVLRLGFAYGQGEGRGEGLEFVGELRPGAPEGGEVVVSAVGEDTGETPEAVVDNTAL